MPGDQRRLGAAVCAVLVAGTALPLGGAAFRAGFHAVETDGGVWRWTDGDATLLLPPSTCARSVRIAVSAVAVPVAVAA